MFRAGQLPRVVPSLDSSRNSASKVSQSNNFNNDKNVSGLNNRTSRSLELVELLIRRVKFGATKSRTRTPKTVCTGLGVEYEECSLVRPALRRKDVVFCSRIRAVVNRWSQSPRCLFSFVTVSERGLPFFQFLRKFRVPFQDVESTGMAVGNSKFSWAQRTSTSEKVFTQNASSRFLGTTHIQKKS